MSLPAGDLADARYAWRARGLLADGNLAGVLSAADVHVAATLGRLGDEPDEHVLLAVALATRAVRLGSVCVDLRTVRATASADLDDPAAAQALPWPEPDAWYAACRRSRIVAVGGDHPPGPPVRLVDELLYLDRYWTQEELVRTVLAARAAAEPPHVDDDRLAAACHRLFPEPAPDAQRLAVAAAVSGWVTVVTGGPGTGKTTTVARLLAALRGTDDPAPRVALAAPTAKAAARLREAVAASWAELGLDAGDVPEPTTLHRLLGYRPGTQSRFKHDRHHRLPYDVVVVDETSMVSLTMMARLLEAVGEQTRLVLVGDADQLVSVAAGAVLGDLVHRPPRPDGDDRSARLARLLPADVAAPGVAADLRNDVVRLTTSHRFGGAIADLAAATRAGDDDAAVEVLRRGGGAVQLVDLDPATAVAALATLRADVVRTGRQVVEAAGAGDAAAALRALDGHRLLCAHRSGPYGVARWAEVVEGWLGADIPGLTDPVVAGAPWYVGQPLLVTANDYDVGLYNSDVGVVVAEGDGAVAVFGRGAEVVRLPLRRLPPVRTVHAMTVHRGQGSQFARVSVVLPPPESPLLTRELLYTAVTRAREAVQVIGTEASLRAAVRRPVLRASGLRRGG